MIEWSLFISKANHSISQETKTMPQPVTLKKLKLNGVWRPTRSFRTNTQKRCPFHYRGLECKSRKSRNTWSNRKMWPWCTEWSRAKANRVCQENALVITNTLFQQYKRRLYTSPDGCHHMVNTEIRLIIFFAAKDGEALYSQQKQERELTVAQIMNSLLPNST